VDEPDRAIDHNERLLREQGFSLVAGVDEAGRGALAGPLVAGAVILPEGFDCDGLKDSKELTPQQRDEWFERIDRAAIAWAVRRAYPTRIDHRGLHKTNVWLLRQVVLALDVRPDFVLADGFRLRTLSMPQLAVKKGDATCASVAAASVMAKVSRPGACVPRAGCSGVRAGARAPSGRSWRRSAGGPRRRSRRRTTRDPRPRRRPGSGG